MEVLGAVASLVTVSELAIHLGKLSKSLYRAARKREEIAHDAQMVANDLGLASESLHMALTSLTKVTAANADSGSDVLRHLEENNVPQRVSRSAQDIRARLDDKIQWIEGMDRGLVIFKLYSWVRHQKPGMHEIMHRIQFVQTSIDIMLNSVMLERNLADARRTQDKTFITRLHDENATIKNTLETLEQRVRLQEQLVQDLSRMEGRQDTTGGLRTEKLVRLSVSIRRVGRVPPASPRSTQPTTPSHTSLGSSDSRGPSVWSEPRDTGENVGERISAVTTPEPEPQAHDDQNQEDDEDEPREIEPRESLVPHPLRLSKPPPPPHTPPVPPIFQTDIGFVDMPPLERRLEIDTSTCTVLALYTYQGEVRHGPVNAECVESSPDNIISHQTARDHGIEFEPWKQGDLVAVDLVGDGERRVLGRTGPVSVVAAARYRSVELCFWVCEEYRPRMIVGRSYVERRKRLGRLESAESVNMVSDT